MALLPIVYTLLLGLIASAIVPAGALRTPQSLHALRSSVEYLQGYTFDDFIEEHNRTYRKGTPAYDEREALFEERRKLVIQFNSKPGLSWKMGLCEFMDYTRAERSRLLGYTGSGSRSVGYAEPAEAAELRGQALNIPTSYSVEEADSKLLTLIRNQGNCGSCWAEAATTVLEGQMARNKTLMRFLAAARENGAKGVPPVPTLSSQMVVSCTPNERHCGGRGGCTGATAELAYDMIRARGGLPFAVEWNYESGYSGNTPTCRQGLFQHPRIAISGFEVLASNRLAPLKEALVASGGPIVVSVDATNWFEYSEGIYSDTNLGRKGDFTVNHAVTLMAYKEPQLGARGYWVIRNSWGDYWGEAGKIRLEMKPNEEEHCGWDYSTHDGLACDGDPDQAWVCGTCGVLYDSTYPTGLHLVL
mmetsp:Transcript_80865/g.187759  ORF Transcript_80865/g.187759 Transcript_80865/m.187759 type:complete len:417 (+) Transcript_80865:58-1308(+)|eukprot:CAMPEP_0171109856 /NCGR_PEP_ID=MMETSP0766_2-20121228/71021_1 /TAXON_ID=439317 /ORGANISM="Gambierdiscus australes, Strain CAWD 149" /LENGTH=416 /DNA_ID=CAMNT_0011571651 /DNA_START=55 /DNA_END=1305 /DNA_ORIENTATION=-